MAPTPTVPIRILIADDRPQVREGLHALLETEDGMVVVGEARNGQEAVEKAAALAPQVVLMDLEMPVLDGLAATARLKARGQSPAVVILTVHAEPWVRDQAKRVGADGFVSKSCTPEVIVQTIRRVADMSTLSD